MRNLFIGSLRIGDNLFRTNLLNTIKLNHDLNLTGFIINKQFTIKHFSSVKRTSTNLRAVSRTERYFSSTTSEESKSERNFSSTISEEPLENDLAFQPIKKLPKREIQSDFEFHSTQISKVEAVDLPKVDEAKFARKFNLDSRNTGISEHKMSLEGAGKPKWHLKNVFYLLKKNEEEDDEKKFKNLNKFNVATDFRKVNDLWVCSITLYHPTKQTFESSSRRKIDAEDSTAYQAMIWLREQGVINAENKPIVLEKQKLKKLIDSKKSILEPLNVKKFNSAQRKYLEDFVDIFELKHRPLLENQIDLYLSNELNRQTLNYQDTKYLDQFYSNGNAYEFNSTRHGLYSMISGRPLKKLNYEELKRINNNLMDFMARRNNCVANNDRYFDQYLEYKQRLQNLPIHNYREQLLDLIFENQVIVISGETGSGKTTQIPQYILEDMINGGCGANCSIIVTQPRRLPAISVSEQSAIQFGEKNVGTSFGYQVRFEKELPIRDNGVVLFCTTGMLLRKMAGNPYLIGVSHLILDEVHEREFLADLTFILLKKILEKNDRIKVILMSASLNAEKFSRYFKNCPIFNIPGRCFPVEPIYLDQIERELRRSLKDTKSFDKRVDYGLVVDLIHHINNKEPGNDSILCFLPGWNDIKKITEDLDKVRYSRNNRSNAPSLSVIPVHSKLTSEEQKAIFKPKQEGVRKVILSTNIAETSITVPDVVFVIDPGLCNETYYNKEYNVSTFGTHLISQANAKQREGRAGRVSQGVCYKLYTLETERCQMLKYYLPEILRIPLESAVMYSKLYCPEEKVDDFLSNALDSPSKTAILSAVQTLKLINVLDKDEHLTLLGRKIVDLSTHPRLSICLVTSAMLGCFNEVLSLTAMLSQPKDPFTMMPGNRSQVRTIKESISEQNLSDYFALYNLLKMHENVKNDVGDYESHSFFNNYGSFINFSTLESARHLKKLFTGDLEDNNIEVESDSLASSNASKSNCLFDLALLSGLYPNVLKYVNERNNQKFQLIDVNTGHQTNYSTESLLSSARIENETYFTSIYFDSFYSEERHKLMIKNASLIPSVYVLFACNNLKLVKEEGPNVTFVLDDCKFLIFTMDKQDLSLILKWKDIFKMYQNWYLCNNEDVGTSTSNIYLKKTFKEFLDITNKVFDRYSKNSEINVKESIGN